MLCINHSHRNHLLVPLPSLKVRQQMSLIGNLINISGHAQRCNSPLHFSQVDINGQNYSSTVIPKEARRVHPRMDRVVYVTSDGWGGVQENQ